MRSALASSSASKSSSLMADPPKNLAPNTSSSGSFSVGVRVVRDCFLAGSFVEWGLWVWMEGVEEEVGGGIVKACMDSIDGTSNNDVIIDLVHNGDWQFWNPIIVFISIYALIRKLWLLDVMR